LGSIQKTPKNKTPAQNLGVNGQGSKQLNHGRKKRMKVDNSWICAGLALFTGNV
jgi:hypothetical protein